jgi:hypothetical protein
MDSKKALFHDIRIGLVKYFFYWQLAAPMFRYNRGPLALCPTLTSSLPFTVYVIKNNLCFFVFYSKYTM